MKIAIIYDSLTGNTKMLAQHIEMTCQNEEIVYIGKPKEIQADLYFIGSWTDKGNCSESIQQYVKTLDNKKIVYFATCGFGGSQTYFDQLKQRFKQILPASTTLVDCFICQGKMPESVKQRYLSLLKKNPDNQQLQLALNNFEQALSHPDQQDLNNLQNLTLQIIHQVKNPQ
ncbi:flavodoxin family protein BilS [Erysipelatoclostridium sp. AM42-17]|uniref:flavodoxin family protein BilS n=1 Tax=Erysipelatoclostridium sp. AM42-17 TaxID=2293102 RepID=UPI000E54F421|nr:flavodoxin family protein BilS [Erysipelatoclostridium sp. AM42-17]RHS94853.1 flavodoxin [Erysipelatoclostridium sp. AM42-17]